ncbi:hypothetical protein HYV83_03495 [Candidatus Woesearchaeota archaeon]|nr:hypothetical protein [Candidatus Woesearchaeota archaeon]
MLKANFSNGNFLAAAVVLAAFAGLLLFTGCSRLETQNSGNSGFLDRISRSTITFQFFINETQEPLDGSVLLNGQLLGIAANGTLAVHKNSLLPGTLTLVGNDAFSGSNFTFYFQLQGSDIGLDRIRFEVPERAYSREIFEAGSINTATIEKSIFAMANEERAKYGIGKLRWNERVAGVARSYSEALPAEGFHHTDLEGRDVKKRLSDEGIIFIAANENLFFSGTVTGETNLAHAAIDGWLSSPGHRATLLDRDGIYSDAGVGVHCERKECYVVMDFAALRQEQKVLLKKGWITFHYLHNQDYNFAPETIPVKLELTATAPVNVYIVPSYDNYKGFADGRKEGILKEFNDVTSVYESFSSSRGNGMVIEAAGTDSEVRFSLDFS